jgi:hypothetical protein
MKNNGTLIGAVFIVIGAITLLSNLHLFWWLNWDILGPAVLVMIGLALVLRTSGRK